MRIVLPVHEFHLLAEQRELWWRFLCFRIEHAVSLFDLFWFVHSAHCTTNIIIIVHCFKIKRAIFYNMMPVKFGFNGQVRLLCESGCYLAFGYRPKSITRRDIQNRTQAINNSLLTCEQEIAREVYEQYRQDGFKYADAGVTPVAIAHEIEVHLKKKGHLDWRIN